MALGGSGGIRRWRGEVGENSFPSRPGRHPRNPVSLMLAMALILASCLAAGLTQSSDAAAAETTTSDARLTVVALKPSSFVGVGHPQVGNRMKDCPQAACW